MNIEITMVDKSEHFEFICTNFKAWTDPKHFDKTSVLHKNSLDAYNKDGKRVSFVHGRLEEIKTPSREIVAVTSDKKNVVIPYDVLVLCTGSEYKFPWRAEGIVNLNERKSVIEKYSK